MGNCGKTKNCGGNTNSSQNNGKGAKYGEGSEVFIMQTNGTIGSQTRLLFVKKYVASAYYCGASICYKLQNDPLNTDYAENSLLTREYVQSRINRDPNLYSKLE